VSSEKIDPRARDAATGISSYVGSDDAEYCEYVERKFIKEFSRALELDRREEGRRLLKAVSRRLLQQARARLSDASRYARDIDPVTAVTMAAVAQGFEEASNFVLELDIEDILKREKN